MIEDVKRVPEAVVTRPGLRAVSNGRPIRVFHLIKGLGRGGAEMLLREGLRVADRDHFVYGYGFLLPWKDQLAPDLRDLGADVVCFNARSTAGLIPAALRVGSYIKRWKPHVIHCHLPLTGVLGRLVGRITGIPVVYTEHNLMERYHPLTRWANRMTWSWQDYVTAVSGEVASSINGHVANGVPVRLVRNGVDAACLSRCGEARLRVRHEYGIPPEAPVIGTVAVFRPQKRLGDWVRAFKAVHETHPHVHGLAVGDGPLRDEFQQKIEAEGMAEKIHLTGIQEEVSDYLSAMDIFLMSSQFEGLPIALLEAMAMELPVVATSVGGIPEVLTNGGAGFLVPWGEPERLAECLCHLLDDGALRSAMGRAARKRVEESFSIDRMVDELEGIYEELVGQPVHAPAAH